MLPDSTALSYKNMGASPSRSQYSIYATNSWTGNTDDDDKASETRRSTDTTSISGMDTAEVDTVGLVNLYSLCSITI